MSMKILDASGRMGGAPFSASELQREQITEAPASATLDVRGFRCHRRSLARDVLLHIFHSFLDDFLHIAEGLLRLAFILFGEALDLLISAPNHLSGLFLHLACDLFDLTLDLILVHDISFEISEKDEWRVRRSGGLGPGNPLRPSPIAAKFRPRASSCHALDQRSGARPSIDTNHG